MQGWCLQDGMVSTTRQQPMTGWQPVVSSHCKKWWRRGHPLAVVLAHDPRPIPSRTVSLVSYSMWYRLSYRRDAVGQKRACPIRYRPCLTEACSVWDGEGEGTSRMCVRSTTRPIDRRSGRARHVRCVERVCAIHEAHVMFELSNVCAGWESTPCSMCRTCVRDS